MHDVRPSSSLRSGPPSRLARLADRCRRYTSTLLVVAGGVIGLIVWLTGGWWALAVAVVAAFWFGAALARPWCRGASVPRR